MNKQPIATISLSLLIIAITTLAPLLDTSIYALNEHPTMWMSFMPSTPLRYMGLTFVSSPFIHLNLEHLAVNLFFFIPIGMMVERKKTRGYLLLLYTVIHLLVLLSLAFIDNFYSFQMKSFLGSSHIVIGLYSYWFIKNRKFGSLLMTIIILIAGLWQTQSPLTILAHGLGFFAGVVALFTQRLTRLKNVKSSH